MLHRNGNLLRWPYSFTSAAVSPHRRRHFRPPTPAAAAAAEDRLKALCRSGRLEEALFEMALLREAMGCSAYDALLTESVNQRALRSGQRVHAHITKTRYLPPIYLSNRIIIMYAKCDEPHEARKVLELMPHRTVVSWTAVISGFSRRDPRGVALQLLVMMMREGELLQTPASCHAIISMFLVLHSFIILCTICASQARRRMSSLWRLFSLLAR